MRSCRVCGKEYQLNNTTILKMLEKIKMSEEHRESLMYIPSCDCLVKKLRGIQRK